MNKLTEQKEAKKSIELTNSVINQLPSNSEVYRQRGANYFKLGQYENALEDFNKAIRITNRQGYSYASDYVNRGCILGKLNRETEAISDLTKAMGLGFDRATVHSDRGCMYFKSGAYDKAIGDFDEAINSYSNLPKEKKSLVPKLNLYHLRGFSYLGLFGKGLDSKKIDINPLEKSLDDFCKVIIRTRDKNKREDLIKTIKKLSKVRTKIFMRGYMGVN